jgi:hypothetical protein
MGPTLAQTLKKSYTLIAATSFVAIAEMAGGPNPANRVTKSSINLFGIAMVIAGMFYLHEKTYDAGGCALDPSVAKPANNRRQLVHFLLVLVMYLCYILAIVTMIRYFSPVGSIIVAVFWFIAHRF